MTSWWSSSRPCTSQQGYKGEWHRLQSRTGRGRIPTCSRRGSLLQDVNRIPKPLWITKNKNTHLNQSTNLRRRINHQFHIKICECQDQSIQCSNGIRLYPRITYFCTCLLILDNSYLVGNLTYSKIAETIALEPLKSWHIYISKFRTC